MADERAGATQPDHFSSDLDTMSQVFRRFGEVECEQISSPLYAAFSFGVADDPELLQLAAARIEGQPPPNILYAAVHYLLLEGVEHELRDFYPALTASPRSPDDGAYKTFRAFCMQHQDGLRKLISKRTVQTNVVRRSAALLPAFALISKLGGGRPIAQVEVGASAGLNLLWNRYHFDFGGGRTWGPTNSPVLLAIERRGASPIPDLDAITDLAWSRGIDLQPVSLEGEDAVRWLRALVWPENLLLAQELAAAIEVGRQSPPTIIGGDASALLPDLLNDAPLDATLCVFGTHTLYQFPRASLVRLLKAMQAHSERRPVYFISMEGGVAPHSTLTLTVYEDGHRQEILLANCHPHGYWLEWLYDAEAR